MFNLIKADLFKLRKSAAIRISFAVTSLSAAAMTAIAYLMAEGRIGIEASGNASMLMDLVMMSIIGSLVAGTFICGDFEHKAIHHAISGGRGRGAVVVGKGVVFFLVAAFLLLPYPLIMGLASVSGYEFGAAFAPSVFLRMLTDNSGAALTVPLVLKMLAITLTMMVVHAARLSTCVLLAFVLKKPALVVGGGIAVTMLGDLSLGLGKSLPILGSILAYTPFAMNHDVVAMDAGAGDLVKAIVVSAAFMAVVLAATYSVFRRSELK